MFKTLLAVVLVSFSVSAQNSLSDKIWDLIDMVKVKLGLVEEVVKLTLPEIPQPRNNPLDTSVYEQQLATLYPANQAEANWSAEKKKKTNIGYIMELFQVVQLRSPQRTEVERWYNIMDQGSSREGLYRALVLGDRYRHLEMLGDQVTTEAIEFTDKYLKTYLQQKTEMDLLRKLDAYRLKKIVVDTTLKTIELLERKPDSLFRWYAVFSSDIAEKFPDIWKYEIRANQSDEFHYRWANATPLQHIKSEIILKLHIIYNHLCQIKFKKI